MEASKIWDQALAELGLQLSPAVFNSWLSGTAAEAIDGDVISVIVPSPAGRDWIEQRLREMIERVVSSICGRVMTLLVVAPNPTKTATPTGADIDTGGDSAETYTFHGFYSPKSHYTQVPNYLLDDVPCHVKPTTYILALRAWRETWGVTDARGNHRKEWVAPLAGYSRLTGLSLNSTKSAIHEARSCGLLVQREVDDATERADYERETGAKLHRNTTLYALRPRWDDEDIDAP